MLIKLAAKSVLSRKGSALLTVIAVAISIFVFVSVSVLKQQTRSNFTRAVSGVDLIVGPKTGALELLLASAFRVGNVNASLSHQTYTMLQNNRLVDWVVPIVMGDSHQGYRVIGTERSYFSHFKYGQKQSLRLAAGSPWQGQQEVVLGAKVAKKLGYQLGQSLIISHGVGKTSFSHHAGFPFKVVGILAPTGTAIDQTIHVSVAGLNIAHGHGSGHNVIHDDHTGQYEDEHEHEGSDTGAEQGPTRAQYSAFLLGVKAKYATLILQQKINQSKIEPTMAIIPGVALTELWQLIGQLETLLSLIASLVLLAALFGLATMLLSSMNERRTEINLFRLLGASPLQVVFLVQLEVLILTLAAMLVASFGVMALWFSSSDWLAVNYGLFVDITHAFSTLLSMTGVVLLSAFMVGLVPSLVAYRRSKNLQFG